MQMLILLLLTSNGHARPITDEAFSQMLDREQRLASVCSAVDNGEDSASIPVLKDDFQTLLKAEKSVALTTLVEGLDPDGTLHSNGLLTTCLDLERVGNPSPECVDELANLLNTPPTLHPGDGASALSKVVEAWAGSELPSDVARTLFQRTADVARQLGFGTAVVRVAVDSADGAQDLAEDLAANIPVGAGFSRILMRTAAAETMAAAYTRLLGMAEARLRISPTAAIRAACHTYTEEPHRVVARRTLQRIILRADRTDSSELDCSPRDRGGVPLSRCVRLAHRAGVSGIPGLLEDLKRPGIAQRPPLTVAFQAMPGGLMADVRVLAPADPVRVALCRTSGDCQPLQPVHGGKGNAATTTWELHSAVSAGTGTEGRTLRFSSGDTSVDLPLGSSALEAAQLSMTVDPVGEEAVIDVSEYRPSDAQITEHAEALKRSAVLCLNQLDPEATDLRTVAQQCSLAELARVAEELRTQQALMRADITTLMDRSNEIWNQLSASNGISQRLTRIGDDTAFIRSHLPGSTSESQSDERLQCPPGKDLTPSLPFPAIPGGASSLSDATSRALERYVMDQVERARCDPDAWEPYVALAWVAAVTDTRDERHPLTMAFLYLAADRLRPEDHARFSSLVHSDLVFARKLHGHDDFATFLARIEPAP